MNKIATLSRSFIVVEVRETACKFSESYDSKSGKVSTVVGMFRQHEHSTIMMRLLFLTCSKQGAPRAIPMPDSLEG